MKFFYSLLFVSLLQSCVVYYNTNDMRNSMNNNIAQIESNYSLTKNDYLEKKTLYEGLESNVLDKNENSFTQISKKKKEFLSFLDKYNQVVASDDRTNINIPFMKQANKVIAKTVMRKKDFKTQNQKVEI